MSSDTFTTTCSMNCHPTLCGMTVTVDERQQVSITGDETNPDSEGFLCMRGKAAHEIVGNDRRLLAPLLRKRRVIEDWSETGWTEALDLIADRIHAVGPERVGFWQSHGNWANDYAFGLKRAQMDRLANLYGCEVWNPAMICWGLGGFGVGITGAIETSTKEDLGANSELVILWGANTVSQANTLRHVEIVKRRGARIVVIDVRRTEASALADEVVLVKPDSNAALALAMMHVIVGDEAWDTAFVKDHTLGFDALAKRLEPFTPDRAETRTGVPAARIVEFARLYAATPPAMIVIGGSSLHKGANTWQAARAISCLPALTGNFGISDGRIGPRHGGRSHGVGFNDLSPADRRPPGDHVPNQMEAIVEALEAARVKVFFAIGSNIPSSFSDTNRLRAALGKADLVVAYDIFPNQTIREVADVVLPGSIWLEEIVAKSTDTHIRPCDKVLPAAGQARPVFELYKGLAKRLDVEDEYPWPNQEAVIDAALDHPATGCAKVETLRANGGRNALEVSHIAYPTPTFITPSGKIEFLSERAARMGLPALLTAEEADDGPEGLRLAYGRTFAPFHAFFDHGQALPTLAAPESRPDLSIAPADAKDRDILDGDPIEVSNAKGTLAAWAKVTPRMPSGTVWIRDGWPDLNVPKDWAAVLPEAALSTFPLSVGQANFGARVDIRSRSSTD